jgi:hypothetical protein
VFIFSQMAREKWLGKRVALLHTVPECTSSHCRSIIHRQVLVVKKILKALKTVLGDGVKIANFIRSRPLNSRFFHCNL